MRNDLRTTDDAYFGVVCVPPKTTTVSSDQVFSGIFFDIFWCENKARPPFDPCLTYTCHGAEQGAYALVASTYARFNLRSRFLCPLR